MPSIHSTIPNITANDSVHPTSNSRSGWIRYTANAVTDQAASGSGRRPNTGARNQSAAIRAARTALGRAPVSSVYATSSGTATSPRA